MAFPVGTLRHEKLRDVHTPHWLDELEAAVCSEAEADLKIAAHKGDASAHHTKTTDASEITSGRFGMARMPDMALGKLMVGQGAGNSPVEGVPAIGLNSVKLPTPVTSDYITPSAMSASSESGAIRVYTGTEADYFHAVTMPGDSSLIRVRVTPPADSCKLYRQRVANPGPESDFSQWIYTGQYDVTIVAAASLGAEVSLFWIDSDRKIYQLKSTDYGVNWGSPDLLGYSPTTAVYGLAAAYKPNGDIALFFADQATLYVMKCISGSWESRVAWDKSTGNLSGIATIYSGGDWNLIISGKNTDGNFKLWKLVYGDGGYQTAGTWSDLIEIKSAPSAEYEYYDIFIDKFGDAYYAFYTEKFTGTEAYARIYWAESSLNANFLALSWHGFKGFNTLDGSYGLAITHSANLMWLSRADGVWQYPCYYARKAADDEMITPWRPNPANEPSAWLASDMGALKICGGCRIYWGAETAYIPSSYRIQVSEGGEAWETVATETAAPPASAWKEYSWNARYARYIRLIVDTHGSSGTEIYEVDYYSRLADRVAAEHGHGSGIEPYLQVQYSRGHPRMAFGETLREIVRQTGNKARTHPSIANFLEYLERQNELVEFLSR